MTAVVYADAGTRDALARQPHALLFGSYRGWSNFGDLLQVQGALAWHRARGGPEPVVVCDADAVGDEDAPTRVRARLGGAPVLYLSAERRDLRPAGLEEWTGAAGIPLLHVYGGGFLNDIWGAASLRWIEALHARFGVAGYVLSGQQVGPEMAGELRRHFARHVPLLAGGRDARSVEVLRGCGAPALPSFDDGIEALSARASRMAPAAASGGVALHLNLSSYTGGPFAPRLGALRGRLARLRETGLGDAGVTLLHAYTDRRPDVVDTLAVVRELGDGFPFGDYRVLDLAALAAQGTGAPAPPRPAAEIAWSASYHVALLCALLEIPCFLEADNDFYRQKRAALGGSPTSFDAFLEAPQARRGDAGLAAGMAVREAWLARLAAVVDATPSAPREPEAVAAEGPVRPWRPAPGGAEDLETLRAWLAQREEVLAWFRTQSESWQRIAAARGAEVERQSRWIAEQEKAKRWLDEERQGWLAIAAGHEDTIRDQQRWIRTLEEGKRWLEARLSGRSR